MILTATKRERAPKGRNQTHARALLALLLAAALAFGLVSCAAAQGETTLTLQLLGVTPSDAYTWLSLSLTGRFDVSVNGAYVGRVTANPDGGQLTAGETDTLVLPDGTDEAVLTPVAEDFTDGFVCNGPVTVTVKAGEANTQKVFAYAQRGFFRVRNVDADGAALGGAAFLVLDGQGAEQWSFETDEQGEYLAGQALPNGEYRLVQTKAAQGAALAEEPVSFTVGTYFGNTEDITDVTVVSSAASQETAEETASITGVIGALGEDENIAIASVELKRSTTTGADGGFTFAGLPGGDYTVYAPLPEGETLAEGGAWSVTQQGDMIWLTVSVAAGETYTLPDAAFTVAGSIGGVAYLDENGDNRYTQGEPAAAGVTVTLQRGDNGAWTQTARQTTDDTGRYAFGDLAAGVYRVLALAGDGYSVAAVGDTARTAEGQKCSGEITLGSGDAEDGLADIAVCTPASVQVSAFFDSNENGQRGLYERPIAGVTVEAVPAAEPDGAAAATAVTDGDGEATLAGLAPDTYVLRFTLPDDYLFTVAVDGWDIGNSCVGGTESLTAYSQPLTLISGETAEAGAGAIPVGSFSGKVWNDENNNGVLDDGEPGMANVLLTLKGEKTGSEYQFTTDDTGDFRFSFLRNDTYAFTAQLPEGTLFARYTKTGGDLRSVFTTEGTTATREFYVSDAEDVTDKNVGVIRPATLYGIAFLDTNYNGVYDEGEPPYAGVTVEVIKNSNDTSMGKVVTGEDGRYAFTTLRGGDYRLRAILPNDGSIFTVVPESAEGLINQFAAREGRRENSIASIILSNGSTTETCVGVAMGGAISGTVFIDKPYDGTRSDSDATVSGVKIQLVDGNGEVVATATSVAKGRYKITGIMPGTYTVRFQRRDGYAFTRYRPDEEDGNDVSTLAKDGYGETEPIALAMGQEIEDVNAGMLPSSTLSGVFFDDLNDNGLMDEGEGGYTAGSVRLVSEDGELDLTEAVAEDGTYFFDGVMPGAYTLYYLLPENATIARVAADGNTLEAQGRQNELTGFVAESGEAYEAPLVGAVTLGTFEGYAYHDANGNNVCDADEQPMAGVTVAVTQRQSAQAAAEAETGADGRFSVTGLRPGDYTLSIRLPDHYIFSGDLTASGLTLDTAQEDTLACPWTALTNRAENAVGAVMPATVTAEIWLDENRDGVRADTERLLSGLNYELYDEVKGRVVKTTASGEDGAAVFTNVRPSTYTVRFTLPDQAQPAGTQGDFERQGSQMRCAGIAVAEGENVDVVSGGMVSYTSIGGTVALYEDGARTTVAGVAVTLYEGDDTQPLQTAVTDEQGAYRFDGLWPDTYRLTAQLPDGMIFVRPNDPNYTAGASVIADTLNGVGESDAFTLQMAQHRLSMDMILIKPARVGDQVWLDSNGNGLVDAGEPTVNGVTIQLLENGEVAYTTVSNEWGYYEFADVYPGTYTLTAQAYPELDITQSIAALRMISSCLTSGDGASAQSDAFSVESGTKNFDYDLGYVLRDGQTLPEAITPGEVQHWPASDEE